MSQNILNKKKPLNKQENIFECEKRLRNEALELAKKHKDVKPIKYLTKH